MKTFLDWSIIVKRQHLSKKYMENHAALFSEIDEDVLTDKKSSYRHEVSAAEHLIWYNIAKYQSYDTDFVISYFDELTYDGTVTTVFEHTLKWTYEDWFDIFNQQYSDVLHELHRYMESICIRNLWKDDADDDYFNGVAYHALCDACKSF